MAVTCSALVGSAIRLEPLTLAHVPRLAEAAAVDPGLYDWSAVPQGISAMEKYVEAALGARDGGAAVPFAIVRVDDNAVLGSTRFFDLDRWPWPANHPRHGNATPDGCEIGYSWLSRSAIRTGANTEAKLLMLTHAFESWRVFRVCFHTDVRNTRSRAAIERIGGKFEGVLRAHRFAVDSIPRDSARYSIVESEWPAVKSALQEKLASHRSVL